MALAFKRSAISVVAGALAAIFAPPPSGTPSEWGAKNLIVPDGPRANEPWDVEMTPYLVEPLDKFGPDDPTNKIVIKKSAQTGFTTLAIVAVGHSIDCDPCKMLLVQPTSDALSDFVHEKLQPAIDNTPALRRKVARQTSRSGEGSTTSRKVFRGGSLQLAIASSTADLRSKTIRKVIKDEASEYPADLDGQGSPHEMIQARYDSFLALGTWKELSISTPTVAGSCYISAEYEAGDQRRWHVVCPGCGDRFVFAFGPNFRFNESFPYEAHYVAPCCGTVISGSDKFALVRDAARAGGGWIATAPGPGRHPSYHFDALSSPFVPWDVIARRWLEAQADPAKLQTFYNLTLGEPFELKGDAPDHVRLMERRGDYRRRTIPPRGLLLVGSADVQLRGIYYEIVAYAPNRESWVVDADVLAGDTTDAHGGAFLALAEVYAREYPDAFGGRRRVDAFGVDSGFRSHVVYEWCRTRHAAYALKGVDGWHKPALGTGSLVDVDLGGRKLAQGCKVWPVGTWSLKGHWYEDLRREGASAGHELDPPGYCHFGKFLDDVYFRQVTAEYLAEEIVKGRARKTWKLRGKEDNHFLDCRIYNMALADHLGLSQMTEDDWRLLAQERAGKLLEQGDLFAPRSVAVRATAGASVVGVPGAPAASEQTEPPARPAPAQSENRDTWIAPRSDWLRRS